MEVISFYHLIDVIVPILKVSILGVESVTRRPTKRQEKDSNAALGFHAKCSLSYTIGCATQASVGA